MSKVVKIPDCMNPFEVIINGMRFKYPAGETVEVPDAVAAVIENHRMHRSEPPHITVLNQSMNIRPDFAQDDPAAMDYVKNKRWEHLEDKPFGEIAPVTLAPVQTVTLSGGPVYTEADIVPECYEDFVEGETYVVKFESESYGSNTYEVTAEVATSSVATSDSGCVLMFGGNYCIVNKNGVYHLYDTGGNTEEATIGISKPGAVKTIDPKYLPDYLPGETVEKVEELSQRYLQLEHNSIVDEYQSSIQSSFIFQAGDKYCISVNGVDYEATAGSGIYDIGVRVENGDDYLKIGCTVTEGALQFAVPAGSSFLDENMGLTVAIYHYETTVRTIDPKYLPDYLPSKTEEEIVVLPETTVALTWISVASAYTGEVTPDEFVPFVVGQTYYVNLDGEQYEVVAEANHTNADKVDLVVNADGSMLEICSESDSELYTFYSESAAWKNFTMSVSTVEATVRTIDPDCLPKATAVADVTAAPTAAEFNALLASLREAGYLEN